MPTSQANFVISRESPKRVQFQEIWGEIRILYLDVHPQKQCGLHWLRNITSFWQEKCSGREVLHREVNFNEVRGIAMVIEQSLRIIRNKAKRP